MNKKINLSLGKCWQSSRGTLVFQCSSFDGNNRSKGYLELNPGGSSSPVKFISEKPEGLLAAGGIAMLVRKYITTGALTAMALSDHGSGNDFLRLTIHGKTAKGEPGHIYFVISKHPDHEITVISSNSSIARLQEKSQYTARKPALEEHLLAEESPQEGFNSWLQSIVEPSSQTEISPAATADNEPLPPYQRAARDRVARRLKTLKKTLQQDEKKLPTLEDLSDAKLDSKFLRDYFWLVQLGSFELRLDAAQTGSESRIIKLNPEMKPGANLEAYFTKVKKLERALELGLPRVTLLRHEIERFDESLNRLRTDKNLSESDVIRILQELGLEGRAKAVSVHAKRQNKASTIIGRRFMTSTGQTICLGRNADESDQLVKSARSQDWWIHVAGGSHGSHVIIADKAFRASLPGSILREAAILALHFSDRGNSREGEVYVARRQQIKKKKGTPAGLWQIDRAETVVIRYEPEELSAIFGREIRDGVQRHASAAPNK